MLLVFGLILNFFLGLRNISVFADGIGTVIKLN